MACLAALLTGVATATFAAIGPAAAAAAPWSIQPSADTTVPDGQVVSVSCFSATGCTAVGDYTNLAGVQAGLAEAWNGSSWRQQPVPNPSGHLPELLGVSCATASFCEAVGYYASGSSLHQFGLAEMWNGTTWVQQSMPRPDGSTLAGLSGVSCVSATFCEAVGSYNNSSGVSVGYAEVWNGTSWKAQSAPAPSGSTFAGLRGVSCVAASFCEAVGTGPGFADQWNGTSWTLQTIPVDAPLSVSCTSADFCEATGNQAAADWNGTSWSAQSVPDPAGDSSVSLQAVSCVSVTFCEATGSATTSSSAKVTLAEAWRGNSWRAQRTFTPAGVSSPVLASVSCATTAACAAGGSFAAGDGTELVIEAWNGTEWKNNPAPRLAGATGNLLNAVSCIAADFCEAVGGRTTRSGSGVNLAERWNGTSWAVQLSAAPAGATGTLYGVSCVSADFCEAVGSGQTAEEWNGKSWTTQTMPGTSYFASVSCVSAAFCVAVAGNAETDVWNGTTWSAQTAAAGFTDLNSVSCASAISCEATGFGPTGEDAEGWNGTSWTAQATPTPSDGNDMGLNSVSCATAHYCEAIGVYQLQSTEHPVTLAEVWNGSSWAIQSTPNPAQAYDTYLRSVWCNFPRSCTAVGYYGTTTSVSEFPTAMVWNGTSWIGQHAPKPAGAFGNSVLEGVSCGVNKDCTAVGSFPDPGGITQTLVETGD